MSRKLYLLGFCILCTACGGNSRISGLSHEPRPSSTTVTLAVGDPVVFKQNELAELASTEAPTGVDQALWSVLKSHLATLLAQSGKAVRAVPTGAGSAAVLVLDPTAQTLRWGYRAQGDYDQNGEVNVADLQPLGVHFSQSSGGGAFATDGVQSVVDGDGNGEINLADLQPIGSNFARRIAQYNVYSSTSFSDVPTTPAGPNGAGAVLVGSAAHTTATGQANQTRLQFMYHLPAFAPGTFYWVRPSDGTADGSTSNAVSSGAVNNTPPLAALQVTPGTGDAPLPVDLDASGSSDPDGANQNITDLLQFQWDFDGDGTYDQTTAGPTVNHVYQNPGTYQPVVQVTDQGGAVKASLPSMVAVGLAGNLPPVPSLLADKTYGHANLNITFDATGTTDDGGAAALTYDWDFDGDGTYDQNTGNVPAVFHTFLTAGAFQVKLKVTDGFNLSATTTLPVTVGSFVENIPPQPVLGSNLNFGSAPITVKFQTGDSTDLDGKIVKYELDFEGDGTYDVIDSVPIVDAECQFVQPGIYYAKLRVTDDKGATGTIEKVVKAQSGNSGGITWGFNVTPMSGAVPLDVTFDASGCSFGSGTIADYGWDWNNDFIIDEHTSNPVIHHVFTDAGTFQPVMWPTSDLGNGNNGHGIGTIVVTDPSNQPPTAHISLLQTSSTYPVTYILDASASTDDDGKVADFKWDFDGDGNYDQDSGPLSFVTHSFYQIGTFTPRVKVTDNDTAADTADSSQLVIPLGWQTQEIRGMSSCSCTSPLIEKYSILGDHTRLLVAVTDNSGNYAPALMVSKPDDLLSWENSMTITPEKCGGQVALTTAGGTPALFYSHAGDPGTGGLSLVHATDFAGTLWSSPVTIDSGGQLVAQRLQAMNYGDRPAVAVYDFFKGRARFAQAIDAAGNTWPAMWSTCSNPGSSIKGLGMCVLANGKPALGLTTLDINFNELKQYFEASADVGGTMWTPNANAAAPDYPDNSNEGTIGCYLVDGQPALAFRGDNGRAYYARASDATGTAWAPPVNIDPTSSYTLHNNFTLVVRDGKPLVICQRNQTDVIAVPALDADGTQWGTPEYIDTAGDVGWNCAATVNGSLVAISYYDSTKSKLKVAYR